MPIAVTIKYHCYFHSLEEIFSNQQRDLFSRSMIDSGGSKNFRTVERGPSMVEFLGSEDCFDSPSHISYV